MKLSPNVQTLSVLDFPCVEHQLIYSLITFQLVVVEVYLDDLRKIRDGTKMILSRVVNTCKFHSGRSIAAEGCIYMKALDFSEVGLFVRVFYVSQEWQNTVTTQERWSFGPISKRELVPFDMILKA